MLICITITYNVTNDKYDVDTKKCVRKAMYLSVNVPEQRN